MVLLSLLGKNEIWRKTMKNLVRILPLVILFLMTNFSFGQQPTPPSNTINLLEGSLQENGLPNGWTTSVDNFDCTIKFQNGAIYFERLSPDEKCSFAFSRNMDNGDYLLKTLFEIDGNEPKILLDGKTLEKQNEIKVTDGVLRVGIQTRGAGKVWGNIFSMTLSKVSKSKVSNTSVLTSETIEKIKEIASNSPVKKYEWKDRGQAPIGYIKGVAVTYANSYYELKTKQKTAVEVMSQPLGEKKNDALAFYGIKANSDVDRLRAVYTLALGLGMRESSGNTTVGWDRSKLKKGIKNTEENAEAGLFQVSWDSRNKSPWLLKLYEQYKAAPEQCSLSIFMEKVRDEKDPAVGTGDGAKFQKFTKECPSFATEYVMIMLRSNRTHFGPIKTKKAEYNLDAERMFKDIEKVIDKTL